MAHPCEDEDSIDLFFELENERDPAKGKRIAAAKDVCATCPFATRQACLEIAMKAEGGALTGRYGVFGGLDPAQRAVLAKERGLETPAAYHPGHGTEARAQVHRRDGEKPCGACLTAEAIANRARVHIRKKVPA
jgi:hypothetical protein